MKAKGGSPAHAGIDPSCRGRSWSRRRLPRTRGDRPASSVTRGGRREAPPHTRGSTPLLRERQEALAGSPAHAGIDPTTPSSPGCRARLPRTRGIDPGRASCGSRTTRLPRTRGDRPWAHEDAVVKAVAPPHTRGSTRRAADGLDPGGGSAAHAGIDPGSVASRSKSSRLPRTRGDRPWNNRRWGKRKKAPPHTRGSTLRPHVVPPTAAGSPAHAGIDLPRGALHPARAWRLPRTRGDRPACSPCSPMQATAPPHTRGSIRLHERRAARAAGSPAHAGIYRTATVSPSSTWRLPRTPGDRPGAKTKVLEVLEAPPHTRGSTFVGGRRGETQAGSPADTALGPCRAAGPISPAGLARTSGQRVSRLPSSAPPHVRGSTQPRAEVRGQRVSRLPSSAPPHVRGSTQPRAEVRRLLRDSPAHAGIDPTARSIAKRMRRLSRRRGEQSAARSSTSRTRRLQRLRAGRLLAAAGT